MTEQAEATWYGELYAIHKLKVAATRMVLERLRTGTQETNLEFENALLECNKLGLTDEILLERLKV